MLVAPIPTWDKCDFCGKKRMLRKGMFTGDWECPSCHNKNKRKSPSPWLA